MGPGDPASFARAVGDLLPGGGGRGQAVGANTLVALGLLDQTPAAVSVRSRSFATLPADLRGW